MVNITVLINLKNPESNKIIIERIWSITKFFILPHMSKNFFFYKKIHNVNIRKVTQYYQIVNTMNNFSRLGFNLI